MIDDDLDLNAIVDSLSAALPPGGPEGYLDGKAAMRDVLVDRRRVSELEAEELIDTLELRGFLHFDGDPAAAVQADARWRLVRDPGPRG